MIVLSHIQVAPLLLARTTGVASLLISTDLGLTRTQVSLSSQGVDLPSGEQIGWDVLAEIADDENGCFLIQDGAARRIQVFSEETARVYSLYPTTGAPTMLISGIPMHRIKDTDPHKDTLAKIRTLGQISGRVLDTCTGLGYTALEATRAGGGAAQVEMITVELDPAAHEIIRCNPWSARLFDMPNITPLIGDVAEVIEQFAIETFSCIIHDPPMFSLAGDLYSLAFYRQCWRVLRRAGKMFHYIGNPESKSGGAVTRGVMRRLQEAGFRRVLPKPEAFGVLALK